MKLSDKFDDLQSASVKILRDSGSPESIVLFSEKLAVFFESLMLEVSQSGSLEVEVCIGVLKDIQLKMQTEDWIGLNETVMVSLEDLLEERVFVA
ncbi:MAG: hypothetical protein P9L91_02625 [Candidatus Zophobacter franzmannii]|nr:hypothetical protein [Candidatus Zophobacter franzmannii]